MKNIKNVCLAICFCMLSAVNITASANENKNVYITETSRYSVEYGREVEKDREEECEVYIAVPWDFSTTISKIPPEKGENGVKETYRPVQTGDDSCIELQAALFILSALGICGVIKKEKTRSNN